MMVMSKLTIDCMNALFLKINKRNMFICHLKHSDTLAVCDVDDKCDNSQCSRISENVELLRNNLKLFIDDNRSDYTFANPARYLIKSNISDEREEWENTINDEQLSLDKLQQNDNDENINKVLSDVIEKEVLKFAEGVYKRKMTIIDFTWDITRLKSDTILRVNSIRDNASNICIKYNEEISLKDIYSNKLVDINSNAFGNFIDKLTCVYDKISIIKPVLSDPYSDEIYLILGNKISDVDEFNIIPMNYEKIIDFLYAMYSYAMYIMNLLQDLKYNTHENSIRFIVLNAHDEYSFIINKCKKIYSLL